MFLLDDGFQHVQLARKHDLVLIDALEKRDLVTRTRSATERRNYELHLTPPGHATLREQHAVASRRAADRVAPVVPPARLHRPRLRATPAPRHPLAIEAHHQQATW